MSRHGKTPLTVFIGYDRREAEAYEVCRSALERRSSVPLNIVKLDLTALQQNGIFNRHYRTLKNGQRIDSLDGKPFSTDFSFTRFLVPVLSLYQGWALYCDCDILFTADIAGLLALADPKYAVMCVKHTHIPSETVKMDGMAQTIYPRKNWSSLVLWNCEHVKNRLVVTRDLVNKMPGSWLHAFTWLNDADIGSLPHTWNWLSGVDEALPETPCGVHFTLGVPTMPGHENAPYADLWRSELTSRRAAYSPLPSERARAFPEAA